MNLIKKLMLFITLYALTYFSTVAQVSITATAGDVGPTSYTNLNAAFAAINAGTHQGAITVSIVANTTEPATPTPLLASGTGASNYTGVTVMPSGGDFTINSAVSPTTNRGIIELAGADNVIIDGDDPLTAGIHNLSIVSVTSTTSGIACVRLSSNSTTGADGADNNSIRNCIITGSRNSATSTVTNYGIQFSNGTGTSSSTTGAYSSLNTIIENNLITRCYYGVHAIGNSSTYLNTGTQIIKNTIGSQVQANTVAYRGIDITYSASSVGINSALISENDISTGYNLTTGASTISSVEIGTNNAGIAISRNYIHDSSNPSSGVWGMYGIHLNSATNNTGIKIVNNIIRDIKGYPTISSLGNQYGGHGIFVGSAVTDLRINNNTIALLGGVEMVGTCIQVNSSSAVISQFQNNILINNVPSEDACAIYTAGTGNISSGVVNNNNYFVNAAGVFGYYNGANVVNMTAWKQVTNKDANSFYSMPNFVSSTDLHILPIQSFLESGGASIASTGVTNDFDDDDRPGPTGSLNGGGTAPDIGADEFDGIPPAAPPVIDNVLLLDAGGQCMPASHNISATVTPGGTDLSTVILNYSFNGTAQTPITMTGGSVNSNSVWNAMIPAAIPGNASVTWSVTVTDPLYSVNSVGTAYNDLLINAAASASDTVVCFGLSTNLSAEISTPVIATIGSATTTSTSTAINPFYGGYGGVKTQYIIRATELVAAGFSAGNINSLGINITNPGATLTDFALNGEMTALDVLTTEIVDVPTNLYSTTSFVPSTGINTFMFDTPIAWDGTSNIILSFCWSNNNTSNTASTITYSATSFVSANARYVDNKTAAQVCGYIGTATPGGWNGGSTTVSNRPNFTINGTAITAITDIMWLDDEMQEVGNVNPVTVFPEVTTTYTAEIVQQGCTYTPMVTVVVPDSIQSNASETSICLGDEFTLSVENINPNPGQNYSYTWLSSLGSGVESPQPGNSITVEPTEPGTYTYEVSTDYVACAITSTIDLVVNPSPIAICTNNGDVFVSDAATSYVWINCETNTVVDGETNQLFTPVENGSYAVIVTNVSGCIDTSACVSINNVGINELIDESLVVYPNPTTGDVTLQFSANTANIELRCGLAAL